MFVRNLLGIYHDDSEGRSTWSNFGKSSYEATSFYP